MLQERTFPAWDSIKKTVLNSEMVFGDKTKINSENVILYQI